MSSGSNVGITYEEVKAYQASMGMATYANQSSGEHITGGILVFWDRDSGYTQSGWQTDVPASPSYGKTEEEIHAMIDRDGNLNELFGSWTSAIDYEIRYDWILHDVVASCREEVQI